MSDNPRKRTASESKPTEPFKPQRKRLSLSIKGRRKDKTDTGARFSLQSSPEIDKYKQKVVPKSTLRTTKWAVDIFDQWIGARLSSGSKVPPDNLLRSQDGKIVCEWLCRFFTEVRKADGDLYCPRSLSSILAGLQRHMQSTSPYSLKIQDTEGDFKPLHVLLENLYKELHEQGIGAVKAQARLVTLEEEDTLWNTGAIGSQSPLSLINAVFYLNGINFTLRGGDEHRSLRISQLMFGYEENMEYVEYTEFGSKNRPGGRKQLNLTNKSVRYYAQSTLGNRCHVMLLRLYLSKLPPAAVEHDNFYCRSLQNSETNKPWFSAAPLGHNTLDRKLKEIFTLANLNTDGISNHSLRATSISRMYHAKVPEKLIMERSGHLSKEGVRSYERTSSKQIQSICKTLCASTVENSEDCSKENAIPQQHFDSPSSKAKINRDSDEETKTKEASDALKQMNFQGLSGCTFNINMYSH